MSLSNNDKTKNSILAKNLKIYDDAQQIKSDIEKHNAGVKDLTNLHKKLENNGSQQFNYDKIRYLSDYEKLSDINNLQKEQLLSQSEQNAINSKLGNYYIQLDNKNNHFIQNLNQKITDRNQIIAINQQEYEKKDLYSRILSSFVITLLGILSLVFMFQINAINRGYFVVLLVIGLIIYLSYVLYLLIKVRYFKNANFLVFKQAMDPNIRIHTCEECDATPLLPGQDGKFVCPGSNDT